MEDAYFLFEERVARFARNWSGREKVKPFVRADVRMDIETNVRTKFPNFIKTTVRIDPETQDSRSICIVFQEDTEKEELAIESVNFPRVYGCMDPLSNAVYRKHLFHATRDSKNLTLCDVSDDGRVVGNEITFKLQ
jgi:hypothetical protein